MRLPQATQALRQSSSLLHMLSVPNTPGYEHKVMPVLVSTISVLIFGKKQRNRKSAGWSWHG